MMEFVKTNVKKHSISFQLSPSAFNFRLENYPRNFEHEIWSEIHPGKKPIYLHYHKVKSDDKQENRDVVCQPGFRRSSSGSASSWLAPP